MSTDEPIRARGHAAGPDGRLVPVEVEVPPGPVADAIRENTLRGLSLPEPGPTAIVAAGGFCAPAGLGVESFRPPGPPLHSLIGQPRPEGPELPPDPNDPPTPEQLQQAGAWERQAAEVYRHTREDEPGTARLWIAGALAEAYAAGYRAGEWGS